MRKTNSKQSALIYLRLEGFIASCPRPLPINNKRTLVSTKSKEKQQVDFLIPIQRPSFDLLTFNCLAKLPSRKVPWKSQKVVKI